MARPKRIHVDDGWPIFVSAALFGYVLTPIPFAILLGHNALGDADPLRIGSAVATVLLLVPYRLSLLPQALPEQSPFLNIPQARSMEEVLQDSSASEPSPKLLMPYRSPEETDLSFHWLAPPVGLFLLWLSAVVGSQAVALATYLRLIPEGWSPAHSLLLCLCLLPGLTAVQKSWALLQKCRQIDHRLLFDFERRQLSLVDVRQTEFQPLWTVEFDQTSLELVWKRDTHKLNICVEGQQQPLELAAWSDKAFIAEALAGATGLAARMQVACYRESGEPLIFGTGRT